MGANDFQAGVLKWHGRSNCFYLLVNWSTEGGTEASRLRVRQWLSDFVPMVTSHQRQVEDTKLYKANLSNQSFVISLGFTRQGLNKLNSRGDLGDIVWREQTGEIRAKDLIFYDNETADGDLDDPHDMLIQVAHEDVRRLQSFADYVKKGLVEVGAIDSGHSTQFRVKVANKLRGRFGRRKESEVIGPLGFVDGRFQESDPATIFDKVKVSERDWYSNIYDTYGTYMSFIRFEVDTLAFKRSALNLGKQILQQPSDNFSRNDLNRFKALILGRHPDGRLTERYDKFGPPEYQLPKDNPDNYFGYAYDSDPNGSKCPFSAHVRAMRSKQPGEAREDAFIIRRGMPFSDWKDGEVTNGLYFISYQKGFADYRSILKRAEYWQDLLIYKPRPDTEASDSNRAELAVYQLDKEGREQKFYPYKPNVLIERAVKWRGEILLYSPSKSFLRYLGNTIAS